MGRYFIEVEHDSAELECVQAVQIFLQTGSHFLTNAEWGCLDGEHKAWLIIEAESKEQARCSVPPAFRSHAKVVGLSKFTIEEDPRDPSSAHALTTQRTADNNLGASAEDHAIVKFTFYQEIGVRMYA